MPLRCAQPKRQLDQKTSLFLIFTGVHSTLTFCLFYLQQTFDPCSWPECQHTKINKTKQWQAVEHNSKEREREKIKNFNTMHASDKGFTSVQFSWFFFTFATCLHQLRAVWVQCAGGSKPQVTLYTLHCLRQVFFFKFKLIKSHNANWEILIDSKLRCRLFFGYISYSCVCLSEQLCFTAGQKYMFPIKQNSI